MPKFTARMDYLKAVYVRYHKAAKSVKGRILDEFCKVCNYHRKHALRLLGRPAPTLKRSAGHRRRAFSYGPAVLQAARMIWKASGYLCGQRLKEAIPLWLPALGKRLRLTPATEQQLLCISARQLDARLKADKLSLRRRFYSTTRPGRLLKSMIPIRTFSGDIRVPGYLEIDLVAHCGTSLQGDFLYTLTATDIFTGWTDRMAVLGRGQTGIVLALKVLEARLPFRLRGLDSDNGDEFINYHLLAFCRERRPSIDFTRSRPYKKNDNAHVEQKNFTHVRTFLGWHRWESPEALCALNELYAQELLWFQNLFQPSTKLKTKVHIGSKIHRTYDRPQMPLDRLIACGVFHRAKVKALRELCHRLDPFELSEAVDQKLLNLRTLACPSPAPLLIRRSPAPQALRYFKKCRRQARMMQKAINGTYFQTSLQKQRGHAASIEKYQQAKVLEVVR
jgi:hypothetical protein